MIVFDNSYNIYKSNCEISTFYYFAISELKTEEGYESFCLIETVCSHHFVSGHDLAKYLVHKTIVQCLGKYNI